MIKRSIFNFSESHNKSFNLLSCLKQKCPFMFSIFCSLFYLRVNVLYCLFMFSRYKKIFHFFIISSIHKTYLAICKLLYAF